MYVPDRGRGTCNAEMSSFYCMAIPAFRRWLASLPQTRRQARGIVGRADAAS